jgi:hypothetical protein
MTATLEALREKAHALTRRGVQQRFAEKLAADGGQMLREARELWEEAWPLAVQGEPATRRMLAADLFPALDWTAENAAVMAEAARNFTDRCGATIPAVEAVEAETRAFATWVVECKARWEMLDWPPMKLDPDQIGRARAAFERGEFESVSDVIARLEQGGPLVKE